MMRFVKERGVMNSDFNMTYTYRAAHSNFNFSTEVVSHNRCFQQPENQWGFCDGVVFCYLTSLFPLQCYKSQ